MLRLSMIAVLLFAVGSNGQAWAQVSECPPTFMPVIAGTPISMDLDEISGLAASRQAPGVYWAVNDSGAPALYAITSSGTILGRYPLSGAGLVDWEDVAVGPGPLVGTDYVYVGDIGNNSLNRSVVRVYRVMAPPVDVSQSFVEETLPGVDYFDLAYPDGAHDCEALVVRGGEYYLLTKDSTGADGGYSIVYRNAVPLQPGVTTPLEEVGRILLDTTILYLATGADLAPDGSGLLLRTYGFVYYWPILPGQSLPDALAFTPCMLPSAPETQSESIAFALDTSGFYTVGEWVSGVPQPIYYYEQPPWELEADPTCGNTTGGLYEVGDRLCLRIPDALAPEPPYRWHRNGEPLVGDGRVMGTVARSLVILPLTVEDSGAYTCTYSTDSKAGEVFGPVTVTVATQLPASGLIGLSVLVLLMALVAVRQGGIFGAARQQER